MESRFSQSQLEAIAAALADTTEGLTGSEIGHLLMTCRMSDPSPSPTKRHRLYNAFVDSQNSRQDRSAVLAFIRNAVKPERYARCTERFEPMRTNLSRALAFAGLAVDSSGVLSAGPQARILSEAERRAQELKEDLTARGVHPDVLRFCRAELVADDYFHAVLEATKSIAEKLRDRTGLGDDGANLVDQALGGNPPMFTVNGFSSESEKGEQRGFANLVKSVFGMFWNLTAYAPRIRWAMNKVDAEDLLSLASLIHRRLDTSKMLPRV